MPWVCNSRSLAGREVEVDMERDVLTDLATGKEFPLKPLGEVPPRWLAKPYPNSHPQ